jgi:hypothetical protein
MSRLCTFDDIDKPIQTKRFEEPVRSVADDKEYKAFYEVLTKAVELEESGNKEGAYEMLRAYEANKGVNNE